MSDTNPTPTPIERHNQADGNILLWLTLDHAQRPWSVDEVARELGDRNDATDALTRLHAVGLIHRMGEFVWATRAAIHAEEIAI
jgi:predicted transcriptional regulator